MDEPASPRSKLLEQIYVRGSDTVIRISEDAVIVKTTREGGIRLPDDMIEVSPEDTAGEKETSADPEDPSTHPDDDDDQDPTKTIEERSTEIPTVRPDELVSDDDLIHLSRNITDDWRSFALCYLDLSATDVEAIIDQHRDRCEQVLSMLRMWKAREAPNATVKSLVEKLQDSIDPSKWEFLLRTAQDKVENQPRTSENDTSVGDNCRRASVDSEDEDLPPISLVRKIHEDDEETVGRKEETEDDPASQIEELTDENKDGAMQEDIKRLTAVYTGFAEEKKDQFTSIGTSLGDILQKVLTLDHENKKQKTLLAKLQKEKERAESQLRDHQRPERKEPTTSRKKDSEEASRRTYTAEDFQKQRENYVKVKGHLNEAIEANREWETFSRNLRDKHKKEIREKNEIIKVLEEKLQLAESSSSDQSRQMDSILNATESQVTDMQKELEKLRSERSEMKERIRRLTEEKRQVEQLSKELLKKNPASGGKIGQYQRAADMTRLEQTATYTDVRYESSVPTDSFQDVMHKLKNVRPPPNDVEFTPAQTENVSKKSSKAKPRSENTPEENDILFLKAQVLQYRKDFDKERRDRERAAGELESLRRELEETKGKLQLHRKQGRNPAAKPKHGDGRQEQRKSKKPGFHYMDPDEVQDYRSNGRQDHQTPEPRHDIDWSRISGTY